MLKVYNYDIVFQEIPDEVTLAVNLTGCPVHCPGCHSPCICLMGGDADPAAVEGICAYIKQEMGLRSAWWSGRDYLPSADALCHYDYIKTGPYIASLGGLKSRTTNQRLYRVTGETLEDITSRFWK